METILAPLSWIYTAVMDVRNWMFNHGWLHEREFGVTTICVGNLAVGGTGKTPHCEWLVNHLLASGYCVATLSRGYGRSTKGYLEVCSTSTAKEVGDEPLQMYHRYKNQVVVAVCEDRCRGIEKLLQHHPEVGIVVLDDAYQHRYVKPLQNVLLTDYSCPYYDDHVLPWGRLREKSAGSARADVIIVSKCPDLLTSEERNNIISKINPTAKQSVFFTSMEYEPIPQLDTYNTSKIALLSGIAHPEPFFKHFDDFDVVSTLRFPDHHNFSTNDLTRIERAAAKADFLITTDKDFARLRSLEISESTRKKLLVQHINVRVIGNTEAELFSSICTKFSK